MTDTPALTEAATLVDQGVALYSQGKLGDAANAFLQAAKLDNNNLQARSNLALVLCAIGRADDAISLLQEAIQKFGDNPVLYNNLAIAFEDEGLLSHALAAYVKSLQAKPEQPYVHSNLLHALNYEPSQTPAMLLAEHRNWAQRFGVHEHLPHENKPDPDRKLRIGYVSPDFRSHPAVYFYEPILRHHDREQFEVFAYANVASPDAVTQRLREHCDGFHFVHGMTDSQLAQRVREDGIDILIDLAGHTGHHRLTMFSRKPAPVQVSYLGYQNTSGLDTMDYRITDDVTDPPGEEAQISETPMRLPCGFLCFQPQPEAPSVSVAPAQQSGRITFGANHRLMKVNDKVLDLWAEVLRAAPDAHLVIFPRSLTRSSMKRCNDALIKRGVAEQRITFHHKTLTGRKYLDVFDEVDLLLDVLPTCAGTTACESLWMGVPVVTLRGDRYGGRMAASVLTRVGLEEFIAETPQQYVDIAVDWAGRIDDLARLRSGMRNRLLASPLCDAGEFVAALEDAYRAMWQTWCESYTKPKLS